jgi:hypothetical protein
MKFGRLLDAYKRIKNLDGFGITGAEGSLLGIKTYGLPTLGPLYVSGPLDTRPDIDQQDEREIK